MGHALLAMVALSRTMTAPHASRVHLDGLVMQGYAANAHQAQSLPESQATPCTLFKPSFGLPKKSVFFFIAILSKIIDFH